MMLADADGTALWSTPSDYKSDLSGDSGTGSRARAGRAEVRG